MHSVSKKSKRRGTNKNARHKEFHKRVRSLGCIVTGDEYRVTLHHILGAKKELKTLENGSVHVGEDAIIPLHPLLHMEQYGDEAKKRGEFNLEAHKEDFIKKNGTELELLEKMMDMYLNRYPDCPYINVENIELVLKRGLQLKL